MSDDAPDNRVEIKMIVTFESSETGELLMYAETAKTLLEIVGKETGARGVFTQPEMLPAAEKLQAAVAEAKRQAAGNVEMDDEDDRSKPPPVSLPQRAWPMIDMLERTAHSGPEAHIMWTATSDF